MIVSLFVLVDGINQLDDYLKHDTPITIILYYYAAMIPVILPHVLPSACLLAALYSLSMMSRSNEITAMKASGVSSYRILRPLFAAGLFLSVALFATNETLAPKAALLSESIQNSLIKRKGEDLEHRSIQNAAILTEGNRMIYAREFLPLTHSLFDVVVLEHHDDMSLRAKIMASRAVYENSEWTFYDVVQYEVDETGELTKKPAHYPKYSLPIKETPEDFIRQYTEPQFMSYGQLRDYLKKTQATGFKASRRLWVDLYSKTSMPFSCFIMLWIAAPLSIRIRRGGAMLSIGVGLIVIVAYYAVLAITSALGKGGVMPPVVAAWAPHLFFLLGGTYLLYKRT